MKTTLLISAAAAALIAISTPSFGQGAGGGSSGGSGAGSEGSINPSGPTTKSGGTATPGTGNAMGKGGSDTMATKSGKAMTHKDKMGGSGNMSSMDKGPANGSTNGTTGTTPAESNPKK